LHNELYKLLVQPNINVHCDAYLHEGIRTHVLLVFFFKSERLSYWYLILK